MSQAGAAIDFDRAISPEVRLAREFMATLQNSREPWSAKFAAWSEAHGWSQTESRAVRVTILRLRTFGIIERDRARRRRL